MCLTDTGHCCSCVTDDVAVLLCECLSAISSLQHDDLLKSLVPDIVEFLHLCSERPRLVVN